MGSGSGTFLHPPEPNPSSKRVVWAVVIIILLAILIGGGYLWTHRNPQPVKPVQTTVTPPPVAPAPPPPEPIKDTIQFAFDKYYLSPAEQANLKDFWEKVGNKPGQISISGYTCNMGKDWHNQWLSERRAERVAKQLGAPDAYPVKVAGFGKTDPVADNSTREGREKNRRAELVFTPAQ